jgi:hypothetical protein
VHRILLVLSRVAPELQTELVARPGLSYVTTLRGTWGRLGSYFMRPSIWGVENERSLEKGG